MNSSQELERSTLKKITWRIVPYVMIVYFVGFFDRINIGFAALTMNQELGFSDAVFGLGAGLFFLGYFITDIPSNIILQKVGPRIWLARILLSWSVITGFMIYVETATGFYIIRFLLGVAEAGSFSGIILYLSTWFPIKRRAQVIALFMAAAPISSMLGSPLAGMILSLDGALGFKGWQLMFLICTIAAGILGVFTLFYVNDRPEKNKWLTESETKWLIATLHAEKQNQSQGVKTSIWKGLTDVRVLTLAIVYFGTSAGLYSLNIWSPQFLKSFSLSMMQIGLLNAIPSALAAISMILWARHSDKTKERTWHVVGACSLACTGFVVAGLATALPFAILALIMANIGISSCKPPLWSIPSLFLSGPAAAAGLAAINAIGNLGGFAGPTLIGWLKNNYGDFSIALFFVAGMLVVSALLTLALEFKRKKMEKEQLLEKKHSLS
ncbi:MFS transporter [Klebsiella oxytoca]|uniref:Putative tartrate transporter n=1 Tax=Klebsiella oxytoca TaxID=571 RepID=A0AAI9GR65_KLEOX|nr:MFS transporter [Klebsiella oxytoca]EJY1765256.1 MFS transporter [Klebsiella oxytoca]EKX3849394.1 MFS transporter [Klebsiella oxytoca]ELM5279629.1 MFS transporter [Klebsiella oxytoca]ELM5281380.1 MFS transporter [Klebsiella oxytoca]MBZ7278393.1 MFS transporter [Klebsiella oxytoca]